MRKKSKTKTKANRKKEMTQAIVKVLEVNDFAVSLSFFQLIQALGLGFSLGFLQLMCNGLSILS